MVDPEALNDKVSWDELTDGSSHNRESSAYTSFEALRGGDYNFGNYFQGYFKAPADGKYRFFIACDDNC